MFGLGMSEMFIIGVIAVLLFGSRLPEVARSLGSQYRDLKKSLSEVTSSFNDVTHDVHKSYHSSPAPRYDDYDDRDEATAPKFVPPPAEPKAEE